MLSKLCFTCGHVWALKPLIFQAALNIIYVCGNNDIFSYISAEHYLDMSSDYS